ncbi:MAG: hypothetical protein GY751_15900 [Bacteroidetes bacterium]|nr:hypothetical protein [Bacteroidota bacterium]
MLVLTFSGCMLAVEGSTERLFPQASINQASAYMNGILEGLQSSSQNDPAASTDNWTLTKKMRSHSVRVGPTTEVNDHPDVRESMIMQRGGWEHRGIENIFAYLAGTTKNDSRVV